MAARAIEAQLATLVDAPPTGPGWLFEIKYDGYRALAYKRGASVTLVSRRGLRFEGFGAIAEKVGALPCREAVLDGEVCALDPEGRPRFELLQAALSGRGAALVYFVFDVLVLDGEDLRPRPLVERKRALSRLVRATDRGPVRRAPAHATDGAAFLEAVREVGLEGLIAKRCDRPYRAGRSMDWQKVKVVSQEEVVVVGLTPPSGSRRGLGALLLATRRDGALHYAGKVGTGFDEETLDALSRRLEPMVVDTPPVVDPPRIRGARWVRPELVAEVRYTEWTRDGKLRHPVFLGLRPDKRAADVVRERPVATKPAGGGAARLLEARRT